MNTILPNRKEAGYRLAQKLSAYVAHPYAVVLGIPRGGIPVAYEIAKNLHLPLDVCLVKKLGLPQNPKVAVGAVAEDALLPNYSGNITIVDEDRTQIDEINREQIKAIAARTKAELRWQDNCYRHYRPMIRIKGRVAIVVDDGMVTGLTMHAALFVLQQHQPAKIIIATPVASINALQQLKSEVQDIITLILPQNFSAVGFWYEDFRQISDREICDLLSRETQMKLFVGSNGY